MAQGIQKRVGKRGVSYRVRVDFSARSRDRQARAPL
jgi:hypothetical protein